MACLTSILRLVLLPLLAAALFYHPANTAVHVNADNQLLNQICNQAQSYDFCFNVLTLDELCLISVAITIDRVQNTSDIIPSLIKQAAGPVDIQRLTTCQSNYTAAVDAYTKAWSSASSRAYYDVLSWIQVGANEVIHCENIYRMSQPIRQSPITVENHDVVKLSEIILITLSMIESGSTGSERENF
ncbi:pectinesterase inhibitor 5-like [Vitis riparia]|uniref:pectinesterase inhibitor 5-like n=1 Tax=Vitis riparia TaxID=96939 RepID=UPI00155AD8D1|nr:pectinesterase inhibitor 5-like [Vitis riparia]